MLYAITIIAGFTASTPQEATIVHTRDAGIIANTGENVQPALAALIAEYQEADAPVRIVLQEGTYRLDPGGIDSPAFPIRGARDLIIEGQGDETLLLLTNPTSSCFVVHESERVTIRNLRVDYSPLPYTQGEIVALDTETGYFDLRIDAGYPLPGAQNFLEAPRPYGIWGMIFDRSSRAIKAGAPDCVFPDRWEGQGDRVWRYYLLNGQRKNLNAMTPGDAYVHLARNNSAVAFFWRSKDCLVENLSIHASPAAAICTVATDALEVRGVRITCSPPMRTACIVSRTCGGRGLPAAPSRAWPMTR